VVWVLPNQPVAMASEVNGYRYRYAPSSGNADAPEQHDELAIAHAEATSDGQVARRSRSVKRSRKRLPLLWASSRRVMHLFDEREWLFPLPLSSGFANKFSLEVLLHSLVILKDE
jgi:hypothetical protein